MSMDRQGQITCGVTWALRVVAAMAAGLILSINDFNF
jgi:type II secretory pathway component PulK